ncbi:MAG: hypothetical protein ACR2RD_10535 [Woeseiaceae bacterium]
MSTTLRVLRNSVLLFGISLLLIGVTRAQDSSNALLKNGPRSEIWLAASSWPTLTRLQPIAGGSFKSYGYGLGGSLHWPVKRFGNRELLLGVEGAIAATDSDIPVALDELLARHGYVAISGKVLMGEAQRVALDAGIAYHLADIAEIATDYGYGVEFEKWEESTAGAYIGVTWEPGARRPEKQGGLSLGFRVHFVDFGTVRDEGIQAVPVLGPDAGDLEGPYYVQIGYRWR